MILSPLVYSCTFLCCLGAVHASELFDRKVDYRWSQNTKVFRSSSTGEWKNRGITGQYSSSDMPLVVKQLRQGEYDIGSMLGYCRCCFIWLQNINNLPHLSKDGIRAEAMRVFYQNRVNKIKFDLRISDEEAQKLAFVVSSSVSWRACRDLFNDFLGSAKNSAVPTGLTHSYTLEEAYIILHVRPTFLLWGPTAKEFEIYTNLIAGALNAVTSEKTDSTKKAKKAVLDKESGREGTLKSIVRAFFDRFIFKEKRGGDVS